MLSWIYSVNPGFRDEKKALYYYQSVEGLNDVMKPDLFPLRKKLLYNIFFPPINWKDLFYETRYTQYFNEMDEYYKFGYRKYIMGELDQALMIFSFCALNGRLLCIKAAAFMWENNLTQSLTWRLGPHNICASYYHFQLYLKGAQSMLKISRIISKFTSPTSPLVHKIYKHLSNTEPEAEIRLLYQFPSNPQTLHSSLSSCISKSLSNQIDIKHLLPWSLLKLYYTLFY